MEVTGINRTRRIAYVDTIDEDDAKIYITRGGDWMLPYKAFNLPNRERGHDRHMTYRASTRKPSQKAVKELTDCRAELAREQAAVVAHYDSCHGAGAYAVEAARIKASK